MKAALFAVGCMALLCRPRSRPLQSLFTTADSQAQYFLMTNLVPQAAVPSHTEVKQSYRSAARSAPAFYFLPPERFVVRRQLRKAKEQAGIYFPLALKEFRRVLHQPAS
jgi:hypothetical protein